MESAQPPAPDERISLIHPDLRHLVHNAEMWTISKRLYRLWCGPLPGDEAGEQE